MKNTTRTSLITLTLSAVALAGFTASAQAPNPAPSALVMAAAEKPGKVAGKISVTKGNKPAKDHSGVVVYLKGLTGGGSGKTGPHEIWQREKQFDPQSAVVVKGETIAFPNGDRIFHNVFSVSRASRFDLGLYKKGESKNVTFKRPGVVDVYCNIHPDMVAKILVLENGYFGRTTKDGSFEINDVPAGTYPIVAWHPQGDSWEGSVTVKAGGTAKVNASVQKKKSAGHSHARKDGSPYGRYK